MSDPEYDADYVEAFNNAQDDEQSLADSERQTAAGCLSTVTIILAVVIALALSFR